MAGDTNIPQDDSGCSEGAKPRWRSGRIVALLAGVILCLWVILEVFHPFGDAVEREVSRLMQPVRRAERNERPFYRRVEQFKNSSPPLPEIARWILGEDNTSNQPNSSEALHDLGEPAVPVLLRLATADSSPAVRAAAIESLGALGATNAFAAISQALASDSAASVRAAAAGALAQLDARAAGPPLLAALAREKEGQVLLSIVRAFAGLEATVAFDPLMQILQGDSSTETRGAAAEALGELKDRRAAPALRSLLVTTNDHNLKIAAIAALGELRDREAVPPLLALLETVTTNAPNSGVTPADAGAESDPSETSLQPWQFNSIRQSIVRALGQIGDARATDSLARVLPGLTDEWEIQAVLDALGDIGDPKAIPALRSVIADHPKHATRAAQVLGRIGNADTTRELIALLDSPDRETRVASAIALANLGERAAVTNLLQAMATGLQSDSKRNIVEALGVVGDPAAVPHLIGALKDSDDDVRTQAVWALANVGERASSEALIRALKDSAFGVRFAGAFALAGMTNAAALPALEALLGDTERRVRTAAACSLAFHGSERGLPQLATALKRLDDWQRFGAVMALSRLNTPAARELARSAVHDRNTGVRKLASEALERGAVPALVSALKEESDEHRHYAARMLLYFDDPAAIPALRAAVRDPRMEVRVAARVALRRLERSAPSQTNRLPATNVP